MDAILGTTLIAKLDEIHDAKVDVTPNTKSSFFIFSSKINTCYFIILTIILLFSLGGPL